ncbi:MAG: hypothetical protein JSR80_02285 [Verrucomicrobia bacterium]|nr:hypothetical protein [Verrucomicrobiota bacterium]
MNWNSIVNFSRGITTTVSLFLARHTHESVSGALLLIGSTWSLVKTAETSYARKLALDGPVANKIAEELRASLGREVIEGQKQHYLIRPTIQSVAPIEDLLKKGRSTLEATVHKELKDNYNKIYYDHTPFSQNQEALVKNLQTNPQDHESLNALKKINGEFKQLTKAPSSISLKAINELDEELRTFEQNRDATIFESKLNLSNILAPKLSGAIDALESESVNYQTQIDTLKNTIATAQQNFPQLPLTPLEKGAGQLSSLSLEAQVGNFTSSNKGVVKVFQAVEKLVEVTQQDAFGEDEKSKILDAAHFLDESLREFQDPLLLKKAAKLAATKNWEVMAPLFCAAVLALISSRLSYKFPSIFFAKMRWLQL